MLSKQADKQAFIFLKDVSFPDLKALVDYMYKGEVNVAQEHLTSFLQTAEALDIKGSNPTDITACITCSHHSLNLFFKVWHTKVMKKANSHLLGQNLVISQEPQD